MRYDTTIHDEDRQRGSKARLLLAVETHGAGVMEMDLLDGCA
ncbi:MAG: hypothetical protein RQ714_03460 [Nitrosomonas sp.]|nr:hypothetical protein [Nitrosomonas sp.]